MLESIGNVSQMPDVGNERGRPQKHAFFADCSSDFFQVFELQRKARRDLKLYEHILSIAATVLGERRQ
jgi:hypothetical protein